MESPTVSRAPPSETLSTMHSCRHVPSIAIARANALFSLAHDSTNAGRAGASRLLIMVHDQVRESR
jgi:hypothetical protein